LVQRDGLNSKAQNLNSMATTVSYETTSVRELKCRA
jgi:hypothetical protein